MLVNVIIYIYIYIYLRLKLNALFCQLDYKGAVLAFLLLIKLSVKGVFNWFAISFYGNIR